MVFAITLEQANAMIAGSSAEAARLGLKPIAVAVVDPGGHLVAFQRQDGASTLRPDIAKGKAAGALSLGMSSRQIGAMAIERHPFFSSIANLGHNGLVAAAGGVIVLDNRGAVVGAIGVSGDTSDNDELAAIAGIAAAGLAPQT
jgi:uncharacterized protein GlcG (DUF336 family)